MPFDKWFIDMLNQNSVSVIKRTYVVVGESEYPIGDPWRRAYMNSPSGRTAVQNEVPEPYKTAIFAVWGNSPTVEDPPEPEPPHDEE